jgi:hypothetical protein
MKLLLGAVLIFLFLACGATAEPSSEQIEFYENNIRPLFAEHCYSCHSDKAEKVKGALRLDTPEALTKGGNSGVVVVPGNPEVSLLIKAVRYTDPDLQMPPKDKKLPADKIANLESWVKMGAPMPRSSGQGRSSQSIDQARARHWAFQPVQKPALPPVKNGRWVKTPVDRFILATLESKHLKPAPSVDRRTLIRRVTYDLIGLPPSPEEVEAFVHDHSRDAYERLVDRLLASPHYGERWGRYWLDIARYADTKGYLAGGEERRYAFSYTYRDYVVRAFNEDKPYDRFVTEQLAADKLGLGEDKSSLAALGFLTLGRRFLNVQNDIIDDRIDVVTRGTLGLTVGCARCHDHKFDPIPTGDYYALHGVFASSEEPAELPLLGPLRDSAQYQDYLKQKEKIQSEIEPFKEKEIEKFLAELRQHVGDYLLGAHDALRLDGSSKFETFAGERKLNPEVLRRWMKELPQLETNAGPVFTPWIELAKLPDQDFSTNASVLISRFAAGSTNLNPVLLQALAEHSPESLRDVAGVYNRVFKQTENDWQSALNAASKGNKPIPAALPEPHQEELRLVLYAEGAPMNVPKSEAERILARRIGEGTAPIRNRIEALNWTHPGAPPRAMALVDRPQPLNSHVLIRGSPGNPGVEVSRHFLEILSGPDPANFTNGSGRIDLARAITSRENPLTSRVFVNRIWLHHFGEGFVTTPGDFGVRTEKPVYRDLLDYLAASFMENGWSTKYLHRLILLSATYQQSCEASPATLQVDPENRYFSRMNRQRLDFEAMRDTLLSVGGHIDLHLGGLPVDLESEPFTTRRTIYGLIERQNLPGMFRTFDFANPDTSSQRRFHTTVPQQALFLMNSPFVIQQAKCLAQRSEVTCETTGPRKIQALYRLVLDRPATTAEIQLGQKFLSGNDHTPNLSPLEQYAQVLLLENEVSFVE